MDFAGGADPLNLAGILTPGARLPALTGNRLVFRDGLPVASLAGGKMQLLTDLDTATEWDVRKLLLRSSATVQLADLT
jgi:ATP-dependent Lhr-like helicase